MNKMKMIKIIFVMMIGVMSGKFSANDASKVLGYIDAYVTHITDRQPFESQKEKIMSSQKDISTKLVKIQQQMSQTQQDTIEYKPLQAKYDLYTQENRLLKTKYNEAHKKTENIEYRYDLLRLINELFSTVLEQSKKEIMQKIEEYSKQSCQVVIAMEKMEEIKDTLSGLEADANTANKDTKEIQFDQMMITELQYNQKVWEAEYQNNVTKKTEMYESIKTLIRAQIEQ